MTVPVVAAFIEAHPEVKITILIVYHFKTYRKLIQKIVFWAVSGLMLLLKIDRKMTQL